MQYCITNYVCIVYYMKCRLMQILAVVIVLDHTVLAPGFNLRSPLDSVAIAGENDILNGLKCLNLAENDKVKLVNTLHVDVNNAIQEFDNVNFAQFPYTNEKQVYAKVNNLLNVKKRVMDSAH